MAWHEYSRYSLFVLLSICGYLGPKNNLNVSLFGESVVSTGYLFPRKRRSQPDPDPPMASWLQQTVRLFEVMSLELAGLWDELPCELLDVMPLASADDRYLWAEYYY
ncbi:hypothetical protein C8R45DRAFT_935969 [Mycena sanguinolenta]|nr:hypothetical protein C8R45DRAFT_935969 [Mycena sanguinolenta]